MAIYETQLKADALVPVSEIVSEWLKLTNDEVPSDQSSFDLYWWDYDDASFVSLEDRMTSLLDGHAKLHDGEVVVRILRPSD